MERLELDDITQAFVVAALRVHRSAGPGALESTYEAMLEIALRNDGLALKRQVPVSIVFEGHVIEHAYRIDMLVEQRVPVEIKSVEKVLPVHSMQLLTYLRHTGLQVGLLLNFKETLLRHGIHRVVNNYTPASPRLRVNSARIASGDAAPSPPARP